MVLTAPPLVPIVIVPVLALFIPCAADDVTVPAVTVTAPPALFFIPLPLLPPEISPPETVIVPAPVCIIAVSYVLVTVPPETFIFPVEVFMLRSHQMLFLNFLLGLCH